MGAVQTSYTERQGVAVAGMRANSEKHNGISRVVEGAAVGFGKVVMQGTADNQVKPIAAGVFDATSSAKVGNTGNGALTFAGGGKTSPGVKEGDYLITIIEPATNGGVFEVQGPDGIELPTGVIGSAYTGPINFTLADGATDFVAGDQFTVSVTQTGAPVIRGVTMMDKTVQPATVADQIPVGDIAGVMTMGVIWVVNGSGSGVVPGTPAYVVPSTGAITKVKTGANIRIPNSTFDSTAANGELVKLRLNLN